MSGKDIDQLSELFSLVPREANFSMEKGYRVTVGSSWKQHPQCYDCFHILYIREGQGEYYIEGERFAFSTGTFIFLGNGVQHSTLHDPANPPHITTVFFSLVDNVSKEKIVLDKKVFFVLNDVEKSVVPECFDSLYYHFYSENSLFKDGFCSLLIGRIIGELLKLVYSVDSCINQLEVDARVSEIVRYIHDNPECRFEVSHLANKVGMTGDYFSRLFKKNMGISLKHFQVRARLRYARFLLEYTGQRVNEVAYRLNYADAYVFSKQFKSFFGISPKDVKIIKVQENSLGKKTSFPE